MDKCAIDKSLGLIVLHLLSSNNAGAQLRGGVGVQLHTCGPGQQTKWLTLKGRRRTGKFVQVES